LQCVLFKAEREAKQLPKAEKRDGEQEELLTAGYARTATITSMTVFDWVMEYFGLQGTETANPQASAEVPKKKVALSLEDFFS